ncbi:MAG TPA: DNA polymerase III subunit alpha, partial [Solirubrobacteraceae bacterium]|nr:DNA polymerase III subunit alpha [Solirubrobacteraceae bacterium]
PLDDAKTYKMLARGDSTGVFQFESDGMRDALKRVGPTEFRDLVALGALYRPGAMAYIPAYAKGKKDPSTVRYPDPRLRRITEETHGCVIYQEQLMDISRSMAGFSGTEADDLRKAIGKKKRDLMATMKDKFMEGLAKSNTAPNVAKDLWKLNEAAADYSFNKSHAACYGLIAYRTAWLKANHTAEYMAALISSVMSTKDKVPFFVARCEEMGIEILPPDVNLSDHEFTVGASARPAEPGGEQTAGGNIRFGLDAVKGVGYQAVEAIKCARDETDPAHPNPRPFSSLWDFCERVDSRAVNKKAIEALIKCGALGSTGASRKGMLAVLETAQAAGQKAQQDALVGQGSIFDLDPPAASTSGGVGSSAPGAGLLRPSHPPIPAEEFDQPQLLAVEKEAIGLFISAHPLKPMREALRARVDCSLAALANRRDKDWVTVGGIITESKKIRTRNGDHMMFATLDDLEGAVEILVFGKALAEQEALGTGASALAVDQVVLVRGRVDHKEAGKTCVIVQSVEHFTPTDQEIERANSEAKAVSVARAAAAQPVRLQVDAARLPASAIEDVKDIIETNHGPAEVVLEMLTSAGTRILRLGEAYRVQHTPGVRAELEAALAPAPALAATG